VKLLLDTHTFIWWDSEPQKLPPETLLLCQDNAAQQVSNACAVEEASLPLPSLRHTPTFCVEANFSIRNGH
jgi:PIN domain nuclease of toxin-antitoxin system